MKIGYARVITEDQNFDLPIDALKKSGMDEIHTEVAGGFKTDRPVLIETVNKLRAGDVLAVWKPDRLGRSLKHLIELLPILKERGVGLLSLLDYIDTTTSHGRLTFTIVASLAEFEKNIIRERTQAGLTAARTRDRKGGLPAQAEQTDCAAETLYRERKLTVAEIAGRLHITKATLYSYLHRRNVPFYPTVKSYETSADS